MASRTVIVSVGTALLVIGLGGLGLVQSGVIPPKAQPPVAQGTTPLGPPASGAALSLGGPGDMAPGRLLPTDNFSSTASVPAAPKPSKKIAPVPKRAGSATAKKAAPRNDPALKAVRRFAARVHNEASADGSRKSDFKQARSRAAAKRPAQGRPALYGMRPVVIRFNFDPGRDRPFSVASLHLGDRVRVRLRQVGPVSRRVYFTFSRGLNSPRGAVLELKTMYSFERPANFRGGQGYYVIQVLIYPDNRWRIMPRSLV